MRVEAEGTGGREGRGGRVVKKEVAGDCQIGRNGEGEGKPKKGRRMKMKGGKGD